MKDDGVLARSADVALVRERSLVGGEESGECLGRTEVTDVGWISDCWCWFDCAESPVLGSPGPLILGLGGLNRRSGTAWRHSFHLIIAL